MRVCLDENTIHSAASGQTNYGSWSNIGGASGSTSGLSVGGNYSFTFSADGNGFGGREGTLYVQLQVRDSQSDNSTNYEDSTGFSRNNHAPSLSLSSGSTTLTTGDTDTINGNPGGDDTGDSVVYWWTQETGGTNVAGGMSGSTITFTGDAGVHTETYRFHVRDRYDEVTGDVTVNVNP